ncbi:hypothetical protein BO94DRAFT_530968 [Aspergillus sclerotioniger CBS 115572]|uniref:Uncharacterized protein n=1 Tax=Aspergillus sclerotioniger CBS 115572 TaxID=1450535 RepID=A0A317XBT8_9EURO|nr:hypothetical protein BO94DRAFT_530968 [Aspergillus sclerotioniger CBS 115572]PWY95077.1 hypothetical protein BO94DRAFT_530968 [Aspergillus sclerotioniger CBS 115572]
MRVPANWLMVPLSGRLGLFQKASVRMIHCVLTHKSAILTIGVASTGCKYRHNDSHEMYLTCLFQGLRITNVAFLLQRVNCFKVRDSLFQQFLHEVVRRGRIAVIDSLDMRATYLYSKSEKSRDGDLACPARVRRLVMMRPARHGAFSETTVCWLDCLAGWCFAKRGIVRGESWAVGVCARNWVLRDY